MRAIAKITCAIDALNGAIIDPFESSHRSAFVITNGADSLQVLIMLVVRWCYDPRRTHTMSRYGHCMSSRIFFHERSSRS